jgi:transcriptional antiterminator RfaH
MVSLDGQYRPVPEALISGIKARCDLDGVFQATDPLSKGDQVQIQRGPFTSFIAEVESRARDQRVWVLIDLLGQKSRISQNQHDLTHAR